MPNFLFGLLCGSLLTGSGLLGMVVAMPIALLLLGAVGWGVFEAVSWYTTAVGTYETAAWYAWPWHWPGAYLTDAFFGMIDQGLRSGREPQATSEWIVWFANVPRAMIAIAINITVAFLPFLAAGQVMRAMGWILAGRHTGNQAGGESSNG